MTFAAVGTIVQSTSVTFSLTPHATGDIILLEVLLNSNSATVTGASSSNATWSVLVPTFGGSATNRCATLLIGTVTATSAQTVTVATTGAFTTTQIAGQEFSTTAGAANVALDTSGHIDSAGTNTWASLTPAGSGELYFGFAFDSGTDSPGSTTGYTYQSTSAGNGMAYNAACTSSAQQPTWGDSGHQIGIMALVKETGAVAVSQPPPPLIPPGFQSPMAFTAFQAVPQGGALVADADTGTGTDTGTVAVAVSDADTGAGADTGSVAVAVSDTDAGTGADTGSVAVAVSDADTGTGADTGSVAVAVSDADTGTGADTATVLTPQAQLPPPLIPPGFQSPMAFTAFMPVPQGGALVSDADTGAGADTGSVAVAVSDADTGTGADTGSVAVAVSDADTGSGADTGSVAVAVSDADTGTGADSGSVVTTVPQPPPSLIPPGFQSPMAFTAFMPAPQGGALVTDADTGTGADTGSVAVAVSGADTGAGADTGSVAVAVSGADSAAGADTGTVAVAVSGADTGAGADAGSVAAAVSDSDTETGADTGSVAVVTPPVPPPPMLIPPGFISPMAFAALQQPHPAAPPESSGHSAAFLVFFP